MLTSQSPLRRTVAVLRALLAVSGSCVACYSPGEGLGVQLQPSDASASPFGDATAEGGQPPDQVLTFSVRTYPVGGRFAPNNVGAIWIEDGAGGLVKTLAVWGRSRNRYLRQFQTASGGDLTDVVTSATLANHETHVVRWDMRNRAGSVVPDGPYALWVELTDKNTFGASTQVPFEKQPEPVLLMPEDTPQFREMSLQVE